MVENLDPGHVKNVANNEIQRNVYVYRTNQGSNGYGDVGWKPNGGPLQMQPVVVGQTVSFPIGGQAGMIANGCPSMVQLLWDNGRAVMAQAHPTLTAADVLQQEPSDDDKEK